MRKNLLLWCSPGFGMVDMWLPVIRKLKKKGDIKIDFVFPEPSSIRLEEKNSTLFNLSEQFVDKVIYKGYSGRWFMAHTLSEARIGIKFSNFDEKISFFAAKLMKGRASKYFLLKIIGKYISAISKYFIFIKENSGNLCLYDFDLLKDTDGILFDVLKEGKTSNKELRNELKNIQKFSMFHGLAVTWLSPRNTYNKSAAKRLNTTVYRMSHLEVDMYKKCCGILDENIIHSGIPRHDNDWIEYVCNQTLQEKPIGEDVFDAFVFIIGRPASSYNTPERKNKALKDIYDIVCSKYKLKLVIKTHPKESLNGIDGSIYRDALGIENYGKNWVYSESHPLILAKKAFFAISFYSGVSLDMLAMNKPTIEYLDLRGLKDYDNKDSFRDGNGNPALVYRQTELVLGASSRLELEQHVESIFNQYEATVLPLRLKYENYFSPFDGASEMVSNDICKKIDDLRVTSI